MTDEKTLIERLREGGTEAGDGGKERLRALCREAAAELEDWDSAFEMYWKGNRRATELYNAAHPGSEGTLPDQGKMIDWLCDELEKARGDTRARERRLGEKMRELADKTQTMADLMRAAAGTLEGA